MKGRRNNYDWIDILAVGELKIMSVYFGAIVLTIGLMLYNIGMEDFDKKENVITVNKDNSGRRVYATHKEFFSMVTLGSNAVVSADESMHRLKTSEYWKADEKSRAILSYHE